MSFPQGVREGGIRQSLATRSGTRAVVQSLESRTLLSTTPIIDVMVLYTAAALHEAGGVSAIDAQIMRGVADMNLAMANSQINASIRLVHTGEVGYSESGTLSTDLNNLQAGNGAFNGIAVLRKEYGADVVSLWVGTSTGTLAGLGFQADNLSMPQPNFAYDVVEEPYADDNYVFAHEIAHALGAGDDRSLLQTSSIIPYAYGKQWTIGSYAVGDIMSGADRAPYFSNPNVSFEGVPTGNPDNSAQPADDARVMNQFAPIVAAYEPSVYHDTTPPVAAVDAIIANPARQTLTVKVEYADNTAVSVSSLGTGDIVVTGPNGFRAMAAYQEIDFNSDGPQRVATYQVSIAGYSADPNAYRITLQPNRLRDIYGNASAGGVLGPPGSAFPDRAGPRLVTAFDAGTLNGTTWRFNNWIDGEDPTAFYRFTISSTTQFISSLAGLSGDVNELLVQDRNSDGQIQSSEVLSYPYRTGTTPESISISLSPGTYDLWVAPPVIGVGSSYTLTMSAAAPVSVPTPTPPPSPTGGTILGNVFNDANADGSLDSGEMGLSEWQVYADLNNNHRLDPGEPTTFTNALGNYRFLNLPPGAYIIRAVPRPGWRQTTPVSNYGVHVTAVAGKTITVQPTGETRQAEISGSVFNDLSADAIRQSSEPGLSGWRVYLDLNNNGSWQPASEPTAVTDSQGNWSFNDLAPGAYIVRVVPQTNWKTTTPAGGVLKLTVAGGQILGNQLFGEHLI